MNIKEAQPDYLNLQRADFNAQVRRLEAGLSAPDPSVVLAVGRELQGIVVGLGNMTIEEVVSRKALFAVDRFSFLQELSLQYANRVALADIFLSPSPAEIEIADLDSRITHLREAGTEFGRPVTDKLESMAKAKITFWWDPKFHQVFLAKETAERIGRDETVPEVLREGVQTQFTEAANSMVHDLFATIPYDGADRDKQLERKINTWEMEHWLERFANERQIIELLASPNRRNRYTRRVVFTLPFPEIVASMRKNPYGEKNHMYLFWLVAFLKEQELVKKRFQRLGITGEDMEVVFLTSVSQLEEKALSFAKIAQYVGSYNEERYQTLVRGALNRIIKDETEVITYAGHPLKVGKQDIVSRQMIVQLTRIADTVGISRQDSLVREAVLASIQRIQGHPDHYYSPDSLIEEVEAAARECEIFDTPVPV